MRNDDAKKVNQKTNETDLTTTGITTRQSRRDEIESGYGTVIINT